MLRRLLVVASATVASCVPADEAIGLGSVSFTVTASRNTIHGFTTSDSWRIDFQRVLLGFRTMTIGKIGVSDQCSYRGRGAVSDTVFDPRLGIVQTFNGIEPTECPDVGIVFTPPGDTTTVGPGARSSDLVFLSADGPSAHAYIEATAKGVRTFGGPEEEIRLVLRFDTTRTSSRFGGCRTATRGIRIKEGVRDEATVTFGAEHLFHEAVSLSAATRFAPFLRADTDFGNADGVVTMDDLDKLSLSLIASETIFAGDTYRLPDGTIRASFGDYVRALFRFTIGFRAQGVCVGNEPGTEE